MGEPSYWGVRCNGDKFHATKEITSSGSAERPDVGTFSIVCGHGLGKMTPQEFGSEDLVRKELAELIPGFKTHPAFIRP
jgi:hypothetical protein